MPDGEIYSQGFLDTIVLAGVLRIFSFLSTPHHFWLQRAPIILPVRKTSMLNRLLSVKNRHRRKNMRQTVSTAPMRTAMIALSHPVVSKHPERRHAIGNVSFFHGIFNVFPCIVEISTLKKHAGLNESQCAHCGWRTDYTLSAHVLGEHESGVVAANPTKEYACEVCAKRFKTSSGIAESNEAAAATAT